MPTQPNPNDRTHRSPFRRQRRRQGKRFQLPFAVGVFAAHVILTSHVSASIVVHSVETAASADAERPIFDTQTDAGVSDQNGVAGVYNSERTAGDETNFPDPFSAFMPDQDVGGAYARSSSRVVLSGPTPDGFFASLQASSFVKARASSPSLTAEASSGSAALVAGPGNGTPSIHFTVGPGGADWTLAGNLDSQAVGFNDGPDDVAITAAIVILERIESNGSRTEIAVATSGNDASVSGPNAQDSVVVDLDGQIAEGNYEITFGSDSITRLDLTSVPPDPFSPFPTRFSALKEFGSSLDLEFEVTVIPEPTTAGVLGLAGLALLGRRGKRARTVRERTQWPDPATP